MQLASGGAGAGGNGAAGSNGAGSSGAGGSNGAAGGWLLRLQDVSLRYEGGCAGSGAGGCAGGDGDGWLLRGVKLELAPGEVVGILGRSGCGKSSLLRAIMCANIAAQTAAGGFSPGSCRCRFRASDLQKKRDLPWGGVFRKKIRCCLGAGDCAAATTAQTAATDPTAAAPTAAKHPKIAAQPAALFSDFGVQLAGQIAFAPGVRAAFMQQNALLFEQFDALKNIALPAIIAGAGEKSALREALCLMQRLGIAELAPRFASELSGGQAQRVALARALGQRAQILLLDEPFSALDFFTRRALQRELAAALGARAAILVTHDVDEALKLSARLFAICGGRLVQMPPDKAQILRALGEEI